MRVSEGEEIDEGDTKAREHRAASILNCFLKNLAHDATVHCSMQEDREVSRSKEWTTNVWWATKRAAQRTGTLTQVQLVKLLVASHPLRDGGFRYALYSFLSEMDRLNRNGVPDDYDDEWGSDAAERFERESSVRRTVQAAGT